MGAAGDGMGQGMGLRLSIENETSLPDGGPLSVAVSGKRGLDIGRDQHLDWTLPDPSRTVSGKHCEVRWRDGGYWLTDVSTNGTYLNGSDRRMQSPYRLRDGDRIEIGHYIVRVAIDGDEAAEGAGASAPSAPPPINATEFWGPVGEAAPPLPRRDLQPVRETRPVKPDFLDWAVEAPGPVAPPESPPPARREEPRPVAPQAPAAPAWREEAPDMDWARGPQPVPAPFEPPPPIPTPRRPNGAQPPTRSAWDEPVAAPPPEPPPIPAAEPAPRPEPTPPAALSGDPEILRRFARGAGIPEEVIAWRDPGEFAELLGGLMRLVAEDLKQLLLARAETKRMARSSDHTMVQAIDNNPLKFSPTPEDALRLMFGRSTQGYLDARRTLEQSFKDLKVHQVKTYAAMQAALRLLVEDMDPQAIEEGVGSDKGLGAMIGSRKAKLWDLYVARWTAKTAPHEDGLVDAFMLYFSECYDRGGGKR